MSAVRKPKFRRCRVCKASLKGEHFNRRWCESCTAQRDKSYKDAEYVSIRNHHRAIVDSHTHNHRSYKDMPFFDGWNPDKGGSLRAGANWIVANLGKRPKGSTLHVVDHEKGFAPGNLEWAHPRKQSNQQMFKIIAQQRHEIKSLKRQLIEAQQVFELYEGKVPQSLPLAA